MGLILKIHIERSSQDFGIQTTRFEDCYSLDVVTEDSICDTISSRLSTVGSCFLKLCQASVDVAWN